MHSVAIDGGEAAAACAIAARVLDVVEDPLLVALFLVEVVQDRLAQPLVPLRQARADRHQQRHGVTHVMVGLRQEFDVQLAGDVAGECALDGGRRQQVVTVGDGVALQLFVQVHRWIPEQRSGREFGAIQVVEQRAET